MAQLYSITDTCRVLNISRTSVYKLISEKRLLVVKIGRRTLIVPGSIDNIVSGVAA